MKHARVTFGRGPADDAIAPRHCRVPDCRAVIPGHRLMCRDDWKLVPPEQREELWSTYHAYLAGQDRHGYDDAVAAAVAAVRMARAADALAWNWPEYAPFPPAGQLGDMIQLAPGVAG